MLLHLAAVGRQGDWPVVAYRLFLAAAILFLCAGIAINLMAKRRIVLTSLAFSATVVCIYAIVGDPWLLGWTLVALALAFSSPARHGLVYDAGAAAGARLARMHGWIEASKFIALWAGLALASTGGNSLLWIVLLYGLSLVAALAFPNDAARERGLGKGWSVFVRDCRDLLRDRETYLCLTAHAVFAALTFAVLLALLLPYAAAASLPELLARSGWLIGGLAAGALFASWQTHVRRLLGLAPLAATIFTGALLVAAVGAAGDALFGVLGVAAGILHVGFITALQTGVDRAAVGSAMALRNGVVALGGIAALLAARTAPEGPGFLMLAIIAAAAAIAVWAGWHRELLEQVVEVLVWPLYRIRGHGPGLTQLPRGPVLIVANHAAWLDPVFIAKVLPRRLTPMMGSAFYDLPGMRWLMTHVVGAIRVQQAGFRRQVPELRQAIAALDRGQAVIIFPEGRMRRTAETPLWRFGQGIWHILRERPSTPVVFCWIEGNWGTFFSYCNGSPTKNKRLDFWRRIDVGVSAPQVVDSKVLEEHWTTRLHCMQMCLEARRHIGLEPFPLPPIAEAELRADAPLEAGVSDDGSRRSIA